MLTIMIGLTATLVTAQDTTLSFKHVRGAEVKVILKGGSAHTAQELAPFRLRKKNIQNLQAISIRNLAENVKP